MSTKYLLLYRSPVGTSRPRPSPAEMQEMMEQFQAWRSKFATEIVDIGDGLLPGGSVCRAEGVTDGPFVEGKEVIGGYMIVEAPTLERAIEVAKEGPMMRGPGASIEIRALAGRSG
ncbi:MAG: YciI family protein [Labilithrix sp.]